MAINRIRQKCDLKYEPEKILKAIKGSAGVITTIAKKLGVSWHTAQTYINEHEITREAYAAEEEKILDIADSKLYEQIKAGESWAIKWLQATKGKKRGYIEKHIQEIQKNPEESKYTPEEVKAIVKAFTGD